MLLKENGVKIGWNFTLTHTFKTPCRLNICDSLDLNEHNTVNRVGERVCIRGCGTGSFSFKHKTSDGNRTRSVTNFDPGDFVSCRYKSQVILSFFPKNFNNDKYGNTRIKNQVELDFFHCMIWKFVYILGHEKLQMFGKNMPPGLSFWYEKVTISHMGAKNQGVYFQGIFRNIWNNIGQTNDLEKHIKLYR